MPILGGDIDTKYLGGKPYVVARDKSGVKQWSVWRDGSTNEADLVPFTFKLTFGPGGIGSTLPVDPNQFDYGYGVETETWDELAPGYLQTKLGLALDFPVTCFATARDDNAAANPYLYVGAGDRTIKIRLRQIGANPALGVVSNVQHTHAAAPRVSSIGVLKDGPSNTIDRAGTIQPSDARILIGFADTAPMKQIDTIGVDAADTYRAGAAAVYAGLIVPGLAPNNNENRVWRTAAISLPSTGAFSRLMSATVIATTKDMTNLTNWDGGPYSIGEFGAPILGLEEYRGGLAAAQAGGVYAVQGQSFNQFRLLGLRSMRNDNNGRNMLAWGEKLYIPTGNDLMEYPAEGEATVGISQLLMNQSPIKGYPSGLARADVYLFVAYYDPVSTDTFIVRVRQRRFSGPHKYTFHPVDRFATTHTYAMTTASDGAGNTYLFYGCNSATPGKYDVGYCIIFGDRRYADGGVWYSPWLGSKSKKWLLQQAVFYGKDCNGSDYWTPAMAWDLGGFAAIGDGSAINTTGRVVKSFTPGTADSGYLCKLRLTCTNPTPTHKPCLWGASVDEEGSGGVDLIGIRQPDTVRRFRGTIVLGPVQNVTGQAENRTAAQMMADLEALLAGYTPLVDEDIHGNRTAVQVKVQGVKELMGPQIDQFRPGQRYAEVTGIYLLNV